MATPTYPLRYPRSFSGTKLTGTLSSEIPILTGDLTVNTILVDMRITVGQGGGNNATWYSRVGGSTTGSFTGDNILSNVGDNNLAIDRLIWSPTGRDNELRINRNDLNVRNNDETDIDTFFNNHTNYSLFIRAPDGNVELPIISTNWRNIGEHYVNLNGFSSADATILDGIASGNIIELIIGTTGLNPFEPKAISLAGNIASGSPVFNAALTNAANLAPVADFTISDSTVVPGQTITLTSTSTDPEGEALTYSWSAGLNQGSFSSTTDSQVQWTAPSTHETADRLVNLFLQADDIHGRLNVKVRTITILATPLPDAPTDVAGATLSTTIITISWTNPTNVTLTDVRIRYRVQGDTDWIINNGPNADDESYNLENLTTGTTYEFEVSAQSGSGWGAWSSTSTRQTNSAPPDAPLAPTTTVISDTQIRVDWLAPNNGGSVITHYDVRERIVGASTWIQTSGFTALNATFAQLTPDTEYEFQVRAVNAIGDGSWSLSGTAQTSATVIPNLTPTFIGIISNQSYIQNSPIATLQLPAAISGNLPLTYSISPTLPAGLNFNATTRQITGTPTAVQASTAYTYTVTDDDIDTATLTFNITVQAQVASLINIDTIPSKMNEVARVLITAGESGNDAKWFSRIGSESIGTIEGDDVIAGSGFTAFDLDRVWWRGTVGEFRINRDPLGTAFDTLADIDDYIASAEGQAKRIYIAVENSSNEVEIVEIDWTQYRNIDGHFVNINQIATDTITLLNTVASADKINLVIGEPLSAISLGGSISSGIPALAGNLTVTRATQTIALDGGILSGTPVLTGNLSVSGTIRLDGNIVSGVPVLTGNLAVNTGIGINTIQPYDNEIIRALINVGEDNNWYSRFNSEDIGSISPSSDIIIYDASGSDQDLTIDRLLWNPTGRPGELRINRDPINVDTNTQGDFDVFFNRTTDYHLYIATENGNVDILIDSNNWRSIGPHFLNLNGFSSADIAILDTVVAGQNVNIVMARATLAIDLDGNIISGTPVLTGDLAVSRVTQSIVLQGLLRSGNATLSGRLTLTKTKTVSLVGRLSSSIPNLVGALAGGTTIISSAPIPINRILSTEFIIKILDNNGKLITTLQNYRSLTYRRVVNAVGSASFIIPRQSQEAKLMWDAATETSPYRWRIQITRRTTTIDNISNKIITEDSIDWYGLIEAWLTKRAERDTDQTDVWEIRCVHVNTLLRDRLILPPQLFINNQINATRTQAFNIKSGIAETVFKDYVREACVDGYALPSRVIPGFTIEPDGLRGNQISFAGQFDNLIESLNLMAKTAGLDYEITSDGGVGFEFKVFQPFRGLNRSLGNGVNEEAIFNYDYSNIGSGSYAIDAVGRSNVLFMLGQGEGAQRTVLEWPDDNLVETWGRREVAIDARGAEGEETIELLETRARGELAERMPAETITIETNNLPQWQYGINWDLGDIVTVQIPEWNAIINKQIRAIRVEFTQGSSVKIPKISADIGEPRPSVVSRLKTLEKQFESTRKL